MLEQLDQIPAAAAASLLTYLNDPARSVAELDRAWSDLGERLDTGHVSNNVYLAGTALDLQVCATAGFIDQRLDAALGLDGLEVASTLVI